jgi:hypothetical protein
LPDPSALPSSIAAEQSSTCIDRCLKQTSHTLVLRGILFRWGGEGFAVFMTLMEPL